MHPSLLLVLLPSLLTLTSSYPSPTGCTPFGTRLSLGLSHMTGSCPQTLSIRFNTRQSCQKSHATIQQSSSIIQKVYCTSQMISFSNYTSYCHTCSIDFLQKGERFFYMVYGWTGISGDPVVPYKGANIRGRVGGAHGNMRLMTLGDWGYLDLKANVYDRLDDAIAGIRSLPEDQQPDLTYMVGDYAYDLSTNYGVSYENFLIMISQMCEAWPCILVTGNHEYKTPNDYMLFKNSFELYNMASNNVSSVDLGAFTLVMFDPYGIIFENASKTQLATAFSQHISQSPKSKPIIVSSHYPLACSVSTTHCKQQRYTLQQFFQQMLDNNIILYIGAHQHTYQRIYPYIRGGNFVLLPSPYVLTPQSKYLVSVVEGIAGNDKSIVEKYGGLANFTAAVSYNVTGFGVLEVDGSRNMLTYQHYKSTDWKNSVDLMQVAYGGLFRTQKYQLREE